MSNMICDSNVPLAEHTCRLAQDGLKQYKTFLSKHQELDQCIPGRQLQILEV